MCDGVTKLIPGVLENGCECHDSRVSLTTFKSDTPSPLQRGAPVSVLGTDMEDTLAYRADEGRGKLR